MGREFTSAAARWLHLTEMDVRPEIVAVCNRTSKKVEWFTENCPSVTQATTDYRELLANPKVDAVYVAVPHNLHKEIYVAAIEAGKHLMGEKPFGRIIEVNCGFLHSSDLDPRKPVNWKRKIETNGEYGSMGDLGMHVLHVPFRAGWYPRDVRAVLTSVITERPDGAGGMTACETWDNATLLCAVPAREPKGDRVAPTFGPYEFPMTVRTHRIAPGEKNSWYLEILGTRASARWSSKHGNTLQVLNFTGGEQAWQMIDMGHEMTHPSISAGIFDAGTSDVILQMWASFLHEMEHGQPVARFAGCVTPEEAAASHRLFTAALHSQEDRAVVQLAGV